MSVENQTGYYAGPQQYDPRPRLDRLMAQMRAHDPRSWGWRPAIAPCLALLVLIVVGNLVSRLVHPSTRGGALVAAVALTLALYGGLVVATRLAGAGLAARFAGWGWTFGLQRPKWIDGAWVAAGFGMAFGGRIVVALVASAIGGDKVLTESQNLTTHALSVTGYVVLAVIVVLVAPVVEELVFRGLLLRTFMWHWGFWPAALVSSLIFALFHVYEVSTIGGALTLAGVVFCLGLANCLLVRWSGRLAAGMIVHALFNALAVLVLILRA